MRDAIDFCFTYFRNPATFLNAYTCLPLSYSTRQAASAILQDVADSGVLFALLMCKNKVCSKYTMFADVFGYEPH